MAAMSCARQAMARLTRRLIIDGDTGDASLENLSVDMAELRGDDRGKK